MLTRRRALKTLIGAGVGAGTLPMWIHMGSAFAQVGAAPKTMIFIYNGGGMCPIQAMPPIGDPFYTQVRPTTAWEPPTGLTRPSVAIPGSTLHAFHPAFAPLLDIWTNSDLALFPAASWEHVNGSHFTANYRLQSGFRTDSSDGFLNRFLQVNPGTGIIPAANIGGQNQHAVVDGNVNVPSFRNASSVNALDDGEFCQNENGGCGENRLLSQMSAMYDRDIVTTLDNRAQVHRQADTLLESLETLSGISNDYTPDGGGQYISGLGGNLSLMAQILKSGVRPSIMASSGGGNFDTHNDLMSAGNQRGFERVGTNLRTFYDDVGPALMQDLVVVCGTEFGRTVRQNGNEGSDHGTGGLWIVMGGGAVSGGIYGQWPTLNPAQVDRRNETSGGITYVRRNTLPFSMDVRDIFGQVMISHLGATATDLGVMFPGHTPTTDSNLFFMTGA